MNAAITDKTKAILINSPNNPTGAVYTPQEVEQLVNMAIENDLWIIDDMIYATLVWQDYPYTSPTSIAGGAERTLTLVGWPKGRAMTGWILVRMFGPTDLMSSVKKVHASAATHVPTCLMPTTTAHLGLHNVTP
mgnify:CR=1 FL=1